MGLRESSTVTVKMLLTIELLHLASVVAQDIHLRKRGPYHWAKHLNVLLLLFAQIIVIVESTHTIINWAISFDRGHPPLSLLEEDMLLGAVWARARFGVLSCDLVHSLGFLVLISLQAAAKNRWLLTILIVGIYIKACIFIVIRLMHSLSLVTRLLVDFLVLMMQASSTLLFRVKINKVGQMIKVLCIT